MDSVRVIDLQDLFENPKYEFYVAVFEPDPAYEILMGVRKRVREELQGDLKSNIYVTSRRIFENKVTERKGMQGHLVGFHYNDHYQLYSTPSSHLRRVNRRKYGKRVEKCEISLDTLQKILNGENTAPMPTMTRTWVPIE